MAIESINSIELISNISEISVPQEMNKVDFSSFLQDVNQSLITSDAMIQKAALGEPVPTHDLMLSIEKATFNLELTIEIRNRLVESYQEIMRMSV